MANYLPRLFDYKEMYIYRTIPVKVLIWLCLFVLLMMFLFLMQIFLESKNENINCNTKLVYKHEYSLKKHRDVSNKDFIHVQANDISVVQKVCDLFEECAAYNSNGWLKISDSSHKSMQADLYIKQKPEHSKCKQSVPTSSHSISSSDYSEMLSHMKIFVYPTNIGLNHRPQRTGGYAVERKFADVLNNSPLVTFDGNAATFFFIPIRCSSYIIDAPFEHQGIIQAKRIIGEILEEIKTRYPYWSWSNGADHFYICAHEIGAGIGDGVLKNAIALVNTADYDDPYFIPHKDISIPATPISSSIKTLAGGSSSTVPRQTLAFFAGDAKSGRIRPALFDRWSRDKEIVLIGHELPLPTYTEHLKRSKFCLVVRGREAWSPRLVEVIFAGCVPVIISNHYHLPFQGIVDWKEFSLIVTEAEVSNLKAILYSVPSSKLLAMQKTLATVYSRFVWNQPARRNDAFYSVMLQLWRRRHVTRYRSRSRI